MFIPEKIYKYKSQVRLEYLHTELSDGVSVSDLPKADIAKKMAGIAM